jgi:hypothetical protein
LKKIDTLYIADYRSTSSCLLAERLEKRKLESQVMRFHNFLWVIVIRSGIEYHGANRFKDLTAWSLHEFLIELILFRIENRNQEFYKPKKASF